MLKAIDTLARRVEASDQQSSWTPSISRATQKILSSEARQAFDLAREPDKVRDTLRRDFWGTRRCSHANGRSESAICAAGTGGWDMHAKIFDGCDNSFPGSTARSLRCSGI